MLRVDGLALSHGKRMVVRDLDLQFVPGMLTALIGPNGAGKSTLLRGLFGAHGASAGNLALDGESYHPRRRRAWQDRFGYMPQDHAEHGGLTALEVVLLGSIGHLSFRLSDASVRAALAGLDRLGITRLADRRIETLSGGQRQLVFVAQSLLREPRVLLLDEPVTALDPRHQMLLMHHVRVLTRERDLIGIVVLHDLNLSAHFADRIVLLDRGRAVADGTPGDVLSSATLRAAYGIDAEVALGAEGRPWIRITKAHEEHDDQD
jgi:iron complex transport system ATP-binding protein